MSEREIEKKFSSVMEGRFMHIQGPAKLAGVLYSNHKVCIAATDQMALAKLLYDLSLREDCYYVKYSTMPRDGMYLGRCFLTTDDAVGKLWATLKSHPKFLTSIQNDDFTKPYRQKT